MADSREMLAKALMMQQARDALTKPVLGDPTNLTDKYNTPLSPQETLKYQAWLQTLPEQQQDTRDYDMQGAFKAGVAQSENGHLPDTFKKPNHPTFSDESKYSGQEGYVGGKWEKLPSGQWAFTPGVSSTRKPMIDPEDLKRYFAKQEAGNVLKAK
jgi:hypothetical protein